MRPKRPRLAAALYVGLQRYLLTFCTAHRRCLFVEPELVDLVLAQILQASDGHGMAILAYCFMPDHLHLLVEGCSEAADARAFVHLAKQRSGHAVGKRYGVRLWQPSYHDRVLRDDDATLSVARYVLENPVRGGLAASPLDYPFCGSCRFSRAQMLEAACWQP